MLHAISVLSFSLSLYLYPSHHHEDSNVKPWGSVTDCIASTLLPHHYHYLASTSCRHEGVRSEGDELSPKKPPYLPEARTTSSLAVPAKLRLCTSQVEKKSGWGRRAEAEDATGRHPSSSTTTVNTWTCAPGGTRGGTYDNEFRGNGRTLWRNCGDLDNKKTAYSSLRAQSWDFRRDWTNRTSLDSWW